MMNMETYEPFVEHKLTALLQQRSLANIGPVVVTCGPLYVIANLDVMNSIEYLSTVEGMPVQPGSFIWFDRRHFLFRCLCAFIRRRGIYSPNFKKSIKSYHGVILKHDMVLFYAF